MAGAACCAVVPVGDEGKYVDIDVLEGRATSSEAPRKEEAAKPLAPSFSSAVQIDPAKPEEFIYGGSILYGSGERESKRARKSQRLIDIERNELEAARGAANIRTWSDTMAQPLRHARLPDPRLLAIKPVERRGR